VEAWTSLASGDSIIYRERMMDRGLACWERKKLEWKKSWIFNLLATEALHLRAKELLLNLKVYLFLMSFGLIPKP